MQDIQVLSVITLIHNPHEAIVPSRISFWKNLFFQVKVLILQTCLGSLTPLCLVIQLSADDNDYRTLIWACLNLIV